MIVGRTIAAVIAGVLVATAAAACVVFAVLALFWVLEPLVGQAGAAALVAGLLAVVVAIIIVVMMSRGGHHHAHHHHGEGGPTDFAFVDRLIDMAKDRPLLSLGAALAAGLIAVRNPALVATIVAAFVDRPKRD